MSDASLEILIKLGVIGKQDAEAVTKLLEEQTEAVKDLSKEMAYIPESMNKAAAASSASGKKVEELTHHGKASSYQMRMLAHVLGHEVPGGAALLHGSMDLMQEGMGSVMGETFLLIGAMEILQQIWKEMSAIDNIKLPEYEGNRKSIEAVRESLEKARLSAALFNDEIFKKANAETTAEESEKRQMENWKSLVDAVKTYNEAVKGLGEADIDAREKNGVITHQQALKEKYDLDVAYAKQRIALEDANFKHEEFLDAQRLAKEQQKLTDLTKKGGGLDQAYKNAKDTEAALKEHDAEKESLNKDIESAQKTLEELGKSHGIVFKGEFSAENAQQLELYYSKYIGNEAGKNHREMFDALESASYNPTSKASYDPELGWFMMHTIGNQAGSGGFAKYDTAQDQVTKSKERLNMLEGLEYDVELNAERGKKALEETEAQISKLTESVKDLSENLPIKKMANDATVSNDRTTENVKLRTEYIKMFGHDTGNVLNAPSAPVSASLPADGGGAGSYVPAGPAPKGNTLNDLMNRLHYNAATKEAILTQLMSHLDNLGAREYKMWQDLKMRLDNAQHQNGQ